MRTTADAGELKIAFTTGILIGIGETLEERADSLLAIRDLDERYGHIQEVIVQNFRRKPEIPARSARARRSRHRPHGSCGPPRPGRADERPALPNLNPTAHRLLLRSGINDWGGISPLTQDYVNPEAPWPHVEKLADTCASEGFTLLPRLPIYPEFIEQEGFLDPALRSAVVAEQERLAIGVATMAPSPLAVAEGTHA